MLKVLTHEHMIIENKARFVEAVITGDIVVSNRKKKEVSERASEPCHRKCD